MHRTEPAQPHQLGNATRVLPIGLDRHRLECVPDMLGLEQFDRQSRIPYARVQPLRQRSGFKPDPRHRNPQTAEPFDQGLWLAGHFGLAHDSPCCVHNA
jgi:hypothetical protein